MSPKEKENENAIDEISEQNEKLVAPQAAPRVYDYKYTNILTFSFAHIAALYGLYLCFTSAKLLTTLFGNCFIILLERWSLPAPVGYRRKFIMYFIIVLMPAVYGHSKVLLSLNAEIVTLTMYCMFVQF